MSDSHFSRKKQDNNHYDYQDDFQNDFISLIKSKGVYNNNDSDISSANLDLDVNTNLDGSLYTKDFPLCQNTDSAFMPPRLEGLFNDVAKNMVESQNPPSPRSVNPMEGFESLYDANVLNPQSFYNDNTLDSQSSQNGAILDSQYIKSPEKADFRTIHTTKFEENDEINHGTDHEKKNEASQGNYYGTIMLNGITLENLDDQSENNDFLKKEHQERMDNILCHALGSQSQACLRHSYAQEALVMGQTNLGRGRSNGGNYYRGLRSTKNDLENYLAQFVLSDDSIVQTEKFKNTYSGISENMFENSPPNMSECTEQTIDLDTISLLKNFKNNEKNSALNSLDRMYGGMHSLCIESILQIPKKETSLSISPPKNSETSSNKHLKQYSKAIVSEKKSIIKTDFFSLYDEKETAKNAIMWDTSYDSFEESFEEPETMTIDNHMDCWAEFDTKTDLIDISFFSGNGYCFEIIHKNKLSIIAIKNAQAEIVQSLHINSKNISDLFVRTMQQNIKDPMLTDIVSLGKRFGIFSIDAKEPWFN